MCLDHTFLTPLLTAPITWKCSGPILFPEWTRLKITEKASFNKMEQDPTRRRWSKPTSTSDLRQDSLTTQCGHLALRTSIPVISFYGVIWSRESTIHCQKLWRLYRWTSREKWKTFHRRCWKIHFWIFEKGANYWFSLVAAILNENKGLLYPIKFPRLSSLKWYITCQMVTYG